MPATTACAISDRRPAHFAQAPATAEAASRPHRQEVRRHRYRTFLLPPARSTGRAERFPSTVSGRFHVRPAHGPPAWRGPSEWSAALSYLSRLRGEHRPPSAAVL